MPYFVRVRLERYIQPQPQPMHKLHKDCSQCSKCPVCMEGVPGYFNNFEETVYKKPIVRKPIAEFQLPLPEAGIHEMAQYAYSISYVEDPQADIFPINFETTMSRHVSLRRNFSSLPTTTRTKFSKRLTQGLAKGFWKIIEVDKLRALGSSAHFLPAA